MTCQIRSTTSLRRIAPRPAATLFSALAFVIFGAGIAAATQTHIAQPIAKPVSFVATETGTDAVSTGRAAHRLCRSPIRFFGTAEPRQMPDCKRISN